MHGSLPVLGVACLLSCETPTPPSEAPEEPHFPARLSRVTEWLESDPQRPQIGTFEYDLDGRLFLYRFFVVDQPGAAPRLSLVSHFEYSGLRVTRVRRFRYLTPTDSVSLALHELQYDPAGRIAAVTHSSLAAGGEGAALVRDTLHCDGIGRWIRLSTDDVSESYRPCASRGVTAHDICVATIRSRDGTPLIRTLTPSPHLNPWRTLPAARWSGFTGILTALRNGWLWGGSSLRSAKRARRRNIVERTRAAHTYR